MQGQLRHRVRTAKKNARHQHVPFDLTYEYLLKLWAKQNGCCAVSGVPLVLDDGKHGRQAFRPSIDRVNPRRGYTKRNVRIVATIVNFGMNKWGHDTFVKVCRAVAERQAT